MNAHTSYFQHVPPHIHQRNSAEQAIQTWKHHLIAWLATRDPNFPPTKWGHLIHQYDITTNLLISSQYHPKLSAQACIYGNFEFNCRPIAPLGTKVIIHETVEKRSRWSSHGIEGWYNDPAIKQYSCNKWYIPSTASVLDVLTLGYFCKKIFSKGLNQRLTLLDSFQDASHPINERGKHNTSTQLLFRNTKGIQEYIYLPPSCLAPPPARPSTNPYVRTEGAFYAASHHRRFIHRTEGASNPITTSDTIPCASTKGGSTKNIANVLNARCMTTTNPEP